MKRDIVYLSGGELSGNNSYATSLVYAKTNQNVKLAESRANDSGVEYIHSEEASYTTYTVDMVKANSSNVYIIEQEEIQLENFESGIYTDEVSATGNIKAESGFSADNAENSEYDGDHNPEYVYNTGDSVGYGLLQWTTLERKQD